jgi:hypothetical protein
MALKNKTREIKKASIPQRAPQLVARAASEHERPVNPTVALQRAATSPPSALRPADILVLQRAVGNRAVNRMLSRQSGALPSQSSTHVNAVQRKVEEEEPLHAKFETDRIRGNRTGLPDGLKSGVESLSGLSLDGVHVHYNSPEPARLNALAYTRGSDIYVSPGQERHLPHEAWHVVQQARGRVRPTMQLKEGVPVNDDEGLEREADVMGAKALMHAGSSFSMNLAQKTNGLSVGNSSEAPVQRLIGFEVEYQVPTFGPTTTEVDFKEGKGTPIVALRRFLFGGFKYGTELGGSAKLGDNSFRQTTDHNTAVSRGPIREMLDSMKKFDPAGVEDEDASSNLEYVTSPVDELAKGSDKVIGKIIDRVSTLATITFSRATGDKVEDIPATAVKASTGTPVAAFRDWLSDDDFDKLEPTLQSFKNNILDSCYIQATIGVLPRAVSTLMQRAQDEEGVHHTGVKATRFYTAVRTVTDKVYSAVSKDEYIEKLKKEKQSQTIRSIAGIIELLVMYLVGEAFSQTNAFPGGTIKNAVPFLVKIDPAKIRDSAPEYLKQAGAIPDDFVTTLANQIRNQKEITVEYWRGLGYGKRDRGKDKWVTKGTVENLIKMFLRGETPEGTDVRTGSRLGKLDTVKIPDAVSLDDQSQKGIPLEYRYVKAKPTAAGLKAELLKIVKEARALNLSNTSRKVRAEIEKRVKE